MGTSGHGVDPIFVVVGFIIVVIQLIKASQLIIYSCSIEGHDQRRSRRLQLNSCLKLIIKTLPFNGVIGY